jgi:hypothetical protein
VVALLAQQGYEPEYGARPLRRVLRRRIENPLATALLEDQFRGAWGVRVQCVDAPGTADIGLGFVPLRDPYPLAPTPPEGVQ